MSTWTTRNYFLTTNDMSKFTKALDMAEGQEVNFSDAVLTTPSQVKKAKLVEKKSRKLHTYIKPSEYEVFVSHIGRETFSEALRKLVLAFNKKKNEQK